MSKKLIIVGIGETADIAYEYFTYDTDYSIVAFSVNKSYISSSEKNNLPIIAFEELPNIFAPKDNFETFVAAGYKHLNRGRTKLFLACKKAGYHCASYISSKAFVWRTAQIGENAFILENNTIQHGVKIGNNVTIWSGNHIGHQTVIEDNVWITSHDVISGYCKIGKNTFIGVNATIGDSVTLGEDIVFGAGSLTIKSLTKKGGMYIGSPAKKMLKSSYERFEIETSSAYV